MDKAQFWRLIEDAKEKTGGDCWKQAQLIEGGLMKLPPDEIVAFDCITAQLKEEAYKWNLEGAAYLINGTSSDDGFEYFRCWLIAQGQAVFENAIQDPDSLADVITPDFADADCESLLYVADRAYEEVTGHEIPVGEPDPSLIGREPVGVKWSEDELNAMLPHISAKLSVRDQN